MLNPVFRREVRTVLRTWKTFIAISVYLLCLGGVAALAFMLMISNSVYSGFNPQQSSAMYMVLSGFQLGLIILIVPALTGGAISSERERQTLDLMLVTKMSTLSIIVGKLVSSLLVVLLLIVASLPVFAILMYYGNVTIINLLAMFGFFMVTACTVGSISILLSTVIKKTVISIVLTYIVLLLLSLGTLVFIYFFNHILASYFFVEKFSYTFCFGVLTANPFMSFLSIVDGQLGMTNVMEFVEGVTFYTNMSKGYPTVPLWILNVGFNAVLSILFVLIAAVLIKPARRAKKYK